MSIDRTWTVVGQVITNAPDQATAQAQVQAAQRAIDTVLAGLETPVTLQLEAEQGGYVFSL